LKTTLRLLAGLFFTAFVAAVCHAADPIPLVIDTRDYPHVRPLVEGRVTIPECRITYNTKNLADLERMFDDNSAGDVIEVDFSAYLKGYSAEEKNNWVLVPVFLWREFPHRRIYVKSDRPITDLSELAGKTVAVDSPYRSVGVWARGIIESTVAVKSDYITWDQSILDTSFHRRLLYQDIKSAEQNYFKETRIFPVVTVLAVRNELQKTYPWLPEALFIAFSGAKEKALEAGTIPLPWGPEKRDETIELMSRNYWSYGIKNNSKTLGAFFKYAREQGVITLDLTPEDVFAPETLQLIDDTGSKN
jgi:4,5-dihydroxyphthalate decarboxylase